MTAWKPPERVNLVKDRTWGTVIACNHEPPCEGSIPYIPESVALERERVLREALERATGVLGIRLYCSQCESYSHECGCRPSVSERAKAEILEDLRAALASQGE